MITKFHTKSVEETEEVAKELAKKLNGKRPELIAMFGDLGVGKTAFVRGLANILAPNTRIKSPTYTIVNEHNGANIPLYHFDMYRIEDEDELYSIGFFDYVQKGICVIEWSENIEELIPKDAYRVTSERAESENERIITIEEADK